MKSLLSPWLPVVLLVTAAFALPVNAADPELPLPDTVLLKTGIPLPSGAAGREIQGAILNETTEELKLETSKFRGISNLLTLPVASIESVKRGDHSERDYLLLKPFLELPETSADADYYQKEALPPIEAYLSKHPASPRKSEITAYRDALALDLAAVLEGDLRFGNLWMRRKEMTPEYRSDIVLWQELGKGMNLSPLPEFKIITDKIALTKNRPYYPYLVEKALATSGKRVQFGMESYPDPAQAAANPKLQDEIKIQSSLQTVDIKSLKKAVLLLGRIQEGVVRPAVDPADLKTLVAECLLAWPSLDGIDYVLINGIKKQISIAESGTPAESTLALKNAGEIYPIIKKVPPTLKTEIDTAGLRQNIQQLMKETRELLGQAKESEAIARINRIQGMVPDGSPLQQSLQDLSIQASTQFTEKGLAESRKQRAAGHLEEALDAVRQTETQLLSYKALDTGRADPLALECVDIASQAAKSLHLITAIKASYAGWSISPTNIKARISCIIVVVSLLAGALIFFIVLLLAFSYVSNLLHKDRFDSRLKILREDEKARRTSSSRKRSGRGDK